MGPLNTRHPLRVSVASTEWKKYLEIHFLAQCLCWCVPDRLPRDQGSHSWFTPLLVHVSLVSLSQSRRRHCSSIRRRIFVNPPHLATANQPTPIVYLGNFSPRSQPCSAPVESRVQCPRNNRRADTRPNRYWPILLSSRSYPFCFPLFAKNRKSEKRCGRSSKGG